MKKFAIIMMSAVALTCASPFKADAAPRAGAMNISSLPDYRNVTQYVFKYHDVWKMASERICKRDTKHKHISKNKHEHEHKNVTPTLAPMPDVYIWNISEAEKLLLKKTVQAECGYNQPDEGVQAVTDVILNRVKNSAFPDSITGVISQPRHFSTYWNGAINRQGNISGQIDRIVEHELKYGSAYPGVLYFTAGRYNSNCKPWKQIGDHYFGY